MHRIIKYIAILALFTNFIINAQALRGYVLSGEGYPLAGASISVKEISAGTIAGDKGYFEINNIPNGQYTLEASFVGYKKSSKKIIVPGENNNIKFFLEEEPVTTGQIIVTASKHEESLLTLPVSAQTLQPESIEKRNILALDEALRYVPGIQINLDQISIRGSSGYSKGAGTRVLTAIDGVPIYTGDTGEIIWEMMPISNIERVEIIKGPASSLYGTNAIGGVVNVISKKIFDKPVTQVSLYGGLYTNPYHSQWKWSDKSRTFSGLGINHSNSTGNLGYSFSLKRMINDGYRENDFNKRTLAFLKLNYDFDSLNTVSLFGSYLNMDRGNFLYWKDIQNALKPKDEDNGNTVNSDRWFASAIYKHKFDTDVSAELKSSIFNTKFEGIGVEVTASESTLLRNEILTYASLSNYFLLVTGAEFCYSTIKSNLFSNKNFYTYSLYTQLEYKGIENLTAAFGIRYDHLKLDSISGSGAVTPKLGINYKLSDKLIVRGSFGTGFRAPTPAEVFTTTSVGSIPIKENKELKFEKSVSYDAGLSYYPVDNIKFDLTLFQNEYENFIEPVLLKTGYIQFINLKKARIQGFEFINENSFIDGLFKTNLGYTYLWSRDLENNSPMKYRPRHSLNAGITISQSPFDFTLDFRFWSKFENIDFDLTRPPIMLVPDGEKQKDAVLFNFSAGYKFSAGLIPIKVYFNIKNIFNYNYTEFIGNIAPIRSLSLSLDLYF